MRIRLQRGGTVFVTALFLFFILCSLSVGIFAWRQGAAKVTFGRTYYFLVRDCGSATAGAVAGESYLAGGAGYLLEEESVVVLACYYREEDAVQIAHTMSENGIETRVSERAFRPFRPEDGASRERIEANLKTADSCARLLYDAANGLELGEISQDEARAAVRGAADAIAGLKGDNGEALFGPWNAELSRRSRRLSEISEGILFPKDLRYVQVDLITMILQAKTYFA